MILTFNLIKKLDDILQCCTDSDIEEFIDENNLDEEQKGEVWRYVTIHNAPDCCKSCGHVAYYSSGGCRCIRPLVFSGYKDNYVFMGDKYNGTENL